MGAERRTMENRLPIKKQLRKQLRIKDYDYSAKGMYFITICTHNRKKILSSVMTNNTLFVGAGLASAQENIKLTYVGKVIDESIIKLQGEFHIDISSYVIMPNHIHMIIDNLKLKRADARPAPTIGDIICSFKSRTAMEYLQINKRKNIYNEKLWQRNYYEHIIRNEKELYKIVEYIEYNPFNWKTDPLNED